jgi:putative ABC transport system substrate-binding protein
MNRRDTVLALVALGSGLGPRIATSQTPSRIRRVGVLSLASNRFMSTWNRRISELGWIDGKNIHVELVNGGGMPGRLAALAAELVKKNVDVILAFGPDAVLAAARATRSIPIVSFGVAFPVEQGLVDSLARPGRNVTGVAWNAAYVKQLEYIRQVSPAARRVAHFFMPTALRKLDGGDFAGLLPEIEATGRSMGLDVLPFRVTSPEELEPALASIKAWRAQAMIVYSTPLTVYAAQQIVSFAAANQIPAFFDHRYFVELGGLMSYGPMTDPMVVQSANQVDRILRGARPSELPVELPTQYEMVINRKTATALGVTIPQSLLLRADEVIQ